MKGDFSRETFRARRHYWGVLRQQGRVDLDADWNEQVRIGRHEHRTRTRDVVGESGGPLANAGFGITAEDDGSLRIGEGRYYVSGILCENDDPTSFGDQPDHPGEAPPTDDGVHLAYLDVWDRLLTAIDDPFIRETALGGPDTTTRGRTVWQVRTTPLDSLPDELPGAVTAYLDLLDEEESSEDEVAVALAHVRALVAQAYCDAPLDTEGGSLAAGSGTLAARASDRAAESDDPCRFEPEGGYQRLENRLYRVEIHQPGRAGEATFKWSRDNGSVVVPVERYDTSPGETTTKRVQVRRVGFDELTSFAQGQWVEVVADDDELAGRPGDLRQIDGPPDTDRRILTLDDRIEEKDLGLHPKVRRWDMPFDEEDDDGEQGQGGLPVVAEEWIELESGVEVWFEDGDFRSGDYWLIPARTATADVEWPPHPAYPGAPTDGEPEDLPPFGIAHRRAPLAAVVREGGRVVTTVDLRRLFPGATALHALRYAGGDGQEPVLGDGLLPEPLQVAVESGDQPVAGALVRFAVEDGEGELASEETWQAAGGAVTVPTDEDGLAAVGWRLDPVSPHHRVRAVMLDACGEEVGALVFFNARVNYQLHYLSGDGQEGTPNDDLTLRPLRVWVSDGRWPLPGANVVFEVSEGSGTLVADDETDADGVAECTWTLDAVTPLQQVTARLLDRDGNAVHEATIAFNARLRRAREVAYEPAGDCVTLQQATTVQEALDELCRREQGGTCTFGVQPGTDVAALFEAIQESDHQDMAICFAEGAFEVDAPLRLAGKGNVRVSGAGKATRIVALKGETALGFDGCASVQVSDLAVEARVVHSGDGLGGALDIVDCGAVAVESVAAACGNAPERRATGITVRRRDPDAATGPVRVRHCDVVVGEQQIGILVINGDRIHIEDNTVSPGELAEGETLGRFLDNARYRAWVRDRKLVSFADPRPDDLAHWVADMRFGEIAFDVPGGVLTFRSEVSGGTRPRIWQEEVNALDPSSPREAKEAARQMADEILRNEGEYRNRQVFRTWYRQMEEEFSVTGRAGIVIGGTAAEDVRVLGNSVEGVLRGVSVGLSGDDGRVHQAGVVRVAGNTIALPNDSLVARFGDGVFVGNCASLLVEDNLVRVLFPQDDEGSFAVDGVRIDGRLGARMIVRANHFDRTVVGANIAPTNPEDPKGTARRRWLAADNVATLGRMLVAPCEVTEDGNVPEREERCSGDRPHWWPGWE